MRIRKPLYIVFFASMLIASKTNATIITINDNFYAADFQPIKPAAPVDPVFGSFSVTFDDSIYTMFRQDFTFTANLPIQSKSLYFDYDQVLGLVSFTDLLNTGGIAQNGNVAINGLIIELGLTNSSYNAVFYAIDGLNNYKSTNVTFTPIVNPVPEPLSIIGFGTGLLGFSILYSRKRSHR